MHGLRRAFFGYCRGSSDDNFGIFCLATCLFFLTCLAPCKSFAEEKAPYGNHFILLLDDSKDAGDVRKHSAEFLTRWLFEGKNKQGKSLPFPAFNTEKDLLSIGTFTIYQEVYSSNPCVQNLKMSVHPDHLFNWWDNGNGKPSRDQMQSWLNDWADNDCVPKGKWTPFLTARLLALTGIMQQEQKGGPFANTYLVVYSNEKGNQFIDSAGELQNYARKGIADVNIVRDMIAELGTHYYIDPAKGWKDVHYVYGDKNSPIFYAMFEVVPRNGSLEKVVTHSLNLTLDRKAISKDYLRVAAIEEDQDVLYFHQSQMDYLEPLGLRWRVIQVIDGEEVPWKFGDIQPTDLAFKSVSLADLEFDENGIASLSLLDLWSTTRFGKDQEGSFPKGKIEFRIDFRVKVPQSKFPIYDQTVVTSKKYEIFLQPRSEVVVKRGLFLGDVPLGFEAHADQWKKSDGSDLTLDVAGERIANRGEVIQKWTMFFLLCALAGALYFLFHWFLSTYYHRPFRPDVDWMGRQPIALDFNNLPETLLMAGHFRVLNLHPVPWFGRFRKNEEQPSREATLKIELHRSMGDMGFELDEADTVNMGLFRGDSDPNSSLVLESRETMVHGKEVPLHLNPGPIKDYRNGHAEVPADGLTLEISGNILIDWELKRHDSKKNQVRKMPFSFKLHLIPETALPPKISFSQGGELLRFKKGEKLIVGHLLLESVSRTHFALPYSYPYMVRALNGHQPMPGEPFTLEEAKPVIVARELQKRVAVGLLCDGVLIPNPRPEVKSYQFRIEGPSHHGSQLGPFPVQLQRDNRPGRPHLEMEHLGMVCELYWNDHEAMQLRLLKQRPGNPLRKPLVEKDAILFDKGFVCFISREKQPLPVMEFTFRNTGEDGDGYCDLFLQPKLEIHHGFENRFHFFEETTTPGELVRIVDELDRTVDVSANKPLCRVKEGEPGRRFQVKLLPELIRRLDEGLLDAKYCRLYMNLTVLAKYDSFASGENGERHVGCITLPIAFKQIAGPDLLCIDFGTSAIAAAIGREDTDEVHLMNLQEIEVAPDISFGKDDPENFEIGSPFLPSFVLCHENNEFQKPKNEDSAGVPDEYSLEDERPGKALASCPPGYHRDAPISNEPGEPGFLAVPPNMAQIWGDQDLIIGSLKSWFGAGSGSIRLGKPIYIAGQPTATTTVPTQEALESAFAGFAETYIKSGNYQTDQVLITYPNTFTFNHRQQLAQATFNALGSRLGLVARDHLKLISESDAIAFYYCQQKRKNRIPAPGLERILVYDFGAGTLDLSLIAVQWDDVGAPRQWQVLGRTGVSIAGNYIDEILARLVHQLLMDPEVMADLEFEYQFPLAGSLVKGQEVDHKRAVMTFWGNLKKAKHAWDGTGDLVIDLGPLDYSKGLVKFTGDRFEESPGNGNASARLVTDGVRIYFAISRQTIESDPRLLDYINFVTQRIFPGLFDKAKLGPKDVTTLLVSGRGAKWPGILPRLKHHFPHAIREDFLTEPIAMKEAVARGAVAAQQMAHLFKGDMEGPQDPLAILVGDRRLIPESEWGPGKKLELHDALYFRIVQVGLPNPEPLHDLNTLNRHFYRDLIPLRYRTKVRYPDSILYAEKKVVDGQVRVELRNSNGQPENPLNPANRASLTVTPPWPIGRTLLSTEDPS